MMTDNIISTAAVNLISV